MKRLSWACLVSAALASGHVPVRAAETAKFKYVAAVYFDAKGGGLSLPEGVACDRDGHFVVGDTGNSRLVRFTYKDRTVSGGTEIRIPEVTAPATVHFNSKGEIYALDSAQRRIVHLGPSGEFKEVLTFSGAPAAGSVVPKALALDAADNIYVLDVFSARVLVLNDQGQFQKALDLPPDAGFGSDITVDPSGTAVLIDSVRRRMYSAAKDASSFAPLGGELAEYIATIPSHITTAKGIIFVVEGSGSTIVAFGRDGSFLSRQLAMGWNEGSLNHPSQLCINDKDEAFIADRDNSRIQIFQLIR